MLRQHRNDSHENTQKTVLEDTDPDNLYQKSTSVLNQIQEPPPQSPPIVQSYIKPCQSTPWDSPDSILASAALLHPGHRPDPLSRLDSAKVILLAMEIRSNIMAQEGEEGRDRERFVAVTNNAEVDGMFVEEDAEPRDERIDRDHQQDANDTIIRRP